MYTGRIFDSVEALSLGIIAYNNLDKVESIVLQIISASPIAI